MISTKKNAVVRLNMLTSLHFLPENLPVPLPSPAPILMPVSAQTVTALTTLHLH